MKHAKKGRKRRVKPLDTALGAVEVEKAREYIASLPGQEAGDCLDVGQVEPCCSWTVRLPGFEEARQSAYKAWVTVNAECEFWREIASADNEREREIVFQLARLRAGMASISQVTKELEDCSHMGGITSSLLARITEAKKAEEKAKHSGKAFFADLAAAEGVSLSSYEASVVIGRKASVARKLCVSMWITYGFWLAGSGNILAFFDQAKVRCPEFTGLDLPKDPQTVQHWIIDLGLLPYRGEGSLAYDKEGTPRPDRTLLGELAHTHANYALLSKHGTDYQVGNCIFWEALVKHGCVRDLGK